jgi:hypothetical protein
MIRHLWTASLSILACCLVLLAASSFSSSQAQQPGKGNPPQVPGRYQITYGPSSLIMLLDTQTGQAWWIEVRPGPTLINWTDMQTPPSQK